MSDKNGLQVQGIYFRNEFFENWHIQGWISAKLIIW